jgi:hypothetical protein
MSAAENRFGGQALWSLLLNFKKKQKNPKFLQ